MSSADSLPLLRADCDRCAGLCCVVPAFSSSADFAFDKAGGTPCPNLGPSFRCTIHAGLRERGFPGCAAYDCFGAGQQVTQVTFGGQDWSRAPDISAQMFEVFPIMRQLHELLWHVVEALELPGAAAFHTDLDRALSDIRRLTDETPTDLLASDIAAHRHHVGELLGRVSATVRARDGIGTFVGAGADLVGADLRHTDLVGADLRGALLIGADLSGTDLSLADLTGADVRATNIRRADLSRAIFLTQAQLEATSGDRNTKVPQSRTRPAHWTG